MLCEALNPPTSKARVARGADRRGRDAPVGVRGAGRLEARGRARQGHQSWQPQEARPHLRPLLVHRRGRHPLLRRRRPQARERAVAKRRHPQGNEDGQGHSPGPAPALSRPRRLQLPLRAHRRGQDPLFHRRRRHPRPRALAKQRNGARNEDRQGHRSGQSGPNSDPGALTKVAGTLFFVTRDGTHYGLWRSDGTAAGTTMLKEVSGQMDYLTAVGGTLYFGANGGLWRSDGTASGTVLVKGFAGGPSWLTDVAGTLFFTADDGSHYGLWRSDGTEAGTTLVKEGVVAHGRAAIGRTLYFTTLDYQRSWLWRSDGTEAGTTPITSVGPSRSGGRFLRRSSPTSAAPSTSRQAGRFCVRTALRAESRELRPRLLPGMLTAVGKTLYFEGYDTKHGDELWQSDGTPRERRLVRDIRRGGAAPTFSTSPLSARPSSSAPTTMSTGPSCGGPEQSRPRRASRRARRGRTSPGSRRRCEAGGRRNKVPLWTISRSRARRVELRLPTRDLHDQGRQSQPYGKKGGTPGRQGTLTAPASRAKGERDSGIRLGR